MSGKEKEFKNLLKPFSGAAIVMNFHKSWFPDCPALNCFFILSFYFLKCKKYCMITLKCYPIMMLRASSFAKIRKQAEGLF